VISFKVEGADLMARKFLLAATAVKTKAVPSGLHKAALLVTRSAKIKAAVDTGTMRAATMPVTISDSEIDVVSFAEYSVYVENGTSRMAAQPFMRPALDENAEQIRQIVGRSVVTTVESVMY
jgi:HK97 gp10 family phage protein